MKNKNFQNAFSLMEMMVVLLIVAIIAAATAPMVTKKMARNVGSGDSPWVYTGLNNNIAYNMNGSASQAIIGATSYNANESGVNNPRLVLAGGDGLAFADRNGRFTSRIMISDSSIAINDFGVGANSVAIGMGQTLANIPNNVVAIGNGVEILNRNSAAIGFLSNTSGEGATALGINAFARGAHSIAIGCNRAVLGGNHPPLQAMQEDSIAIGTSALARGRSSIAIGTETETGNNSSQASNTIGEGAIAIGNIATAKLRNSIAIGNGAETFSPAIGGASQDSNTNAIAIGTNSQATNNNSVAIGAGAHTTNDNQIVLGTDSDTVYIRGNLVVGGTTMLGERIGSIFYARAGGFNNNTNVYWFGRAFESRFSAERQDGDLTIGGIKISSDRRLKNVGKKYTAGLEELKKLDFYHYTFKADKDNTPLVGVMAQDLQKVFPDAVTKGDDGYLRIRLEDMFYAVINAVKELDAKVSQIVADVTGISSKVDEQQKVIEAQQQKIDELEKANADFEKRLAKLEKKNKKFEE